MHTRVIARVTTSRLARHQGDLDRALNDLLAPYCMYGGWPQRLVFEVQERTWRNEHAQAAMRDRYATFEAFCVAEQSHGVRHPETGRWGYWTNVNAQWDDWTIGGRWAGHFPVRGDAERRARELLDICPSTPGRADVVYLDEIDFAETARRTRQTADALVDAYRELLATQNRAALGEHEDGAVRVGLLHLVEGPAVPGEGEIALRWFTNMPPSDERSTWTGIARLVDPADIVEQHLWLFDPLQSPAAVDDDGWHALHFSGSWATSDESPIDTMTFMRAFVAKHVL